MSLLRSLFGPSKQEIWQQLAHELNARYTDGGLWHKSFVDASVGEWTVRLDTYTVSTGKSTITYTRMRAPYFNKDGFRFKVYRKGLFSGIGKFLGMQDIEIGHPQFDEDFILQGNDETKVRQLLTNSTIRQLFDVQPTISLEVKDDDGWLNGRFPEGVDQLYFQVTGVIKDVDRLKALYDLFAEILHELTRIGSAYEGDPQVRLK